MEETQQNWFALSMIVETAAAEAIEFALNELESLGTEIDSLGKKAAENIEIIGYFNEKPSDEILKIQIDEALRIYGFSNEAVIGVEWREVPDQDWLVEWKKHWKPTITDKFIIAPPWEAVENSDKIVIKIEPNMAFGTGTHETTKLCLRAIEKHLQPGMSFFDLGTGTGILSIAVAKLRAQLENDLSSETNRQNPILGCDTDADSIKIAGENAELNGEPEIEFYIGSISDETPQFDFVCANVTADVIVPLLPFLVEKAKKILVLSGILAEQRDFVSEKLREMNITDFDIETMGEWIGVTIEIS